MSSVETMIREWRIGSLAMRRQLAEVGTPTTVNVMREVGTPHEAVREISEEDIERQLAEEGLVRVPPANQQRTGDFKRIDVGGKPMSEMIIEERR